MGDGQRFLLRVIYCPVSHSILCPCNHLLTSQARDQAGDSLCVVISDAYEQLTPSCLYPLEP